MGIISVEHIDRLYWLGRYAERVYTTVGLFAEHYDSALDSGLNDYDKFCERLDIPNIYQSEADFCERYCFDENDPNSIYSNLMRAYDNAVVMREEIGSDALSYIQLAVYAMQKAKVSTAPLVELQAVIDNILAFWGITDDWIEDEETRNIIKVGKRVERVDLYGRLHMERSYLLREVHRLTGRIKRTSLNYNEEILKRINAYAMEVTIPYWSIVQEVENLIEW